MNWIISDVVGRVLTRKSFMRLSITRWCREAFDSHGATWLPLQRGLRARAQQLGFRGERPVSIGWAVCHDTSNFGATAWHAAYIERFSARIRSSTRRTTRSFASWSNFFGIFQIFPSTQTEQNLGHFIKGQNVCLLGVSLVGVVLLSVWGFS